MSAGIEIIASTLPIITAQIVFSKRRMQRGVENISTNPVFGCANLLIASGQILKGVRAAEALAISKGTMSAAANIEATSKVAKVAKKAVNFTSDHINPVIWLAGLCKALFGKEEDKGIALSREITALGTMRIGEELYKALFGMPTIKKIDGHILTNPPKNTPLINEFFSKVFSTQRKAAIKDFINTKRTVLNHEFTLKPLVGGTQGLGFVTASILFYKLGQHLATMANGEPKTAQAKQGC